MDTAAYKIQMKKQIFTTEKNDRIMNESNKRKRNNKNSASWQVNLHHKKIRRRN